MAASSFFFSSIAVLIFFNILFYLFGFMPSMMVTSDAVIGLVITLGIIAVLISLIPLTSGSSAVKWFISTILVTCLLFSYSFTLDLIVFKRDVNVGIGLCGNLMGLFSSSVENITFMPYLFFLSIGLLGLISGVITLGGGGD